MNAFPERTKLLQTIWRVHCPRCSYIKEFNNEHDAKVYIDEMIRQDGCWACCKGHINFELGWKETDEPTTT